MCPHSSGQALRQPPTRRHAGVSTRTVEGGLECALIRCPRRAQEGGRGKIDFRIGFRRRLLRQRTVQRISKIPCLGAGGGQFTDSDEEAEGVEP